MAWPFRRSVARFDLRYAMGAMIPPEEPHHHPAHTGRRWLDMVLALSAMFVSVISLIVAVEHGRTMDRLVTANSWPFVQFATHNLDEHDSPMVRLVLTNEGIGPARIETFELWWNGQPMSSPKALMDACCLTSPVERAQQQASTMFVGAAAPNILRAGEHVDFFGVAGNQHNADLFDKLNVERDKITVRVCYCSVFDECWRSSGETTRTDRVAACPTPAVPFQVSMPAKP
jgi:hypothetical protein